jgi:hypothetical protein
VKWTGGEFIAARFVLREDGARGAHLQLSNNIKFSIPDAAEE